MEGTSHERISSPFPGSACDADMLPTPKPMSTASRIMSAIKTTLLIPIALVGSLLAIVIFAVFTLSGIGPLIEFCLSKRDEKALDRVTILEEHSEMFLLQIPSNINKASLGQPYQVMIRLTRPTNVPDTPLPPVILPGGLASNLMTMARLQDELTSKHGFTVVNYNRLGVGFSDPFPQNTTQPPSAADVAREMNYVMSNCGVDDDDVNKWIQIGGSMGTNVATAFCALYPDRLCGFFNLDGVPHAFIQIQCKKFLKDGPALMKILKRLRWTGLCRLAFYSAVRPMLPALGDVFTPQQIVGIMCREQFFTTTGLEYVTLMSCCDLEIAAWGPQATTEYANVETLRTMACLAPYESVVVNEMKGIPRTVTEERSESELGTRYLSREEIVEFEGNFRALALESSDAVDRQKTHCNWPQSNPSHPVGDFVGGVNADTTIYPLTKMFETMVVRVMCARNYKGLERDYVQEARNHAAARTSLHVLASRDGKAYYYPRLSHLNLWQQCGEIVDIAYEMSQAIEN